MMNYKLKMVIVIALTSLFAVIVVKGILNIYRYMDSHPKNQPIKIFVCKGYSIHGYGDTVEVSYNNMPTTIIVADYSVEFVSMDSIIETK